MSASRNLYQFVLRRISFGFAFGGVGGAAFATGLALEEGPTLALASNVLLWLIVCAMGWAVCGVLARVPQDD